VVVNAELRLVFGEEHFVAGTGILASRLDLSDIAFGVLRDPLEGPPQAVAVPALVRHGPMLAESRSVFERSATGRGSADATLTVIAGFGGIFRDGPTRLRCASI
jgi:hypothetical protein